MKNSFVILVIMLFTLLLFSESNIYTQVKFPIQISDTAEDAVGQRLIYHVKETIRASQSMRLTEKKEPRIVLMIRTMDRFKGESNKTGFSTMYSAIWLVTMDAKTLIYLDDTIGHCGSNLVKISAEGIVAQTDKLLSESLNGK